MHSEDNPALIPTMTSDDLDKRLIKKIKIMTHFLYTEHLQTKIEMDPINNKHNSVCMVCVNVCYTNVCYINVCYIFTIYLHVA